MNALSAVIVGNHVTVYPADQAEAAAAEAARLRDSGQTVHECRMTATELALLAVEQPQVTVTYGQPAGSAGQPVTGRVRRFLRWLRG